MKKVVSASRRTDLVASFPRWLSEAAGKGRARVLSPSGHVFTTDLNPGAVHTFVLWSKDFSNLLKDRHGLRHALEKYDQLYCHFTITGLGGSFIERGVPEPELALSQLEPLVALVGCPGRVSLRFDPVVYWKEKGSVRTNLHFFGELAKKASAVGIKDIRTSFAQWYGKSARRAAKHGFEYLDPESGEKMEAAQELVQIARSYELTLYACSQSYLSQVAGIQPSACIDGKLLQSLHPGHEPAPQVKDKSQRRECLCTESVDIGSYTQSCPHACLYCYANPRTQ